MYIDNKKENNVKKSRSDNALAGQDNDGGCTEFDNSDDKS